MKIGPDDAVRALARVNPVPDAHAFVDTMTRADAFLTALETREDMDTKQATPTPAAGPTQRRTGWITAAAAAAVIVVVVGAVAITNNSSDVSVASTPQGMADAFFVARSSGDVEGSLELLAEDAVIRGENAADPESYADTVRWLGALGWTFTRTDCNEVAPTADRAVARLECGYEHSNSWSRALGLESFDDGGQLVFEFGDGEIVAFENRWRQDSFSPMVWEPFVKWVYENHPDVASEILVDGCCTAAMTPDAINLWVEMTDGYIADVSG